MISQNVYYLEKSFYKCLEKFWILPIFKIPKTLSHGLAIPSTKGIALKKNKIYNLKMSRCYFEKSKNQLSNQEFNQRLIVVKQ